MLTPLRSERIRFCLLFLFIALPFSASAQSEEENFDAYGDADSKGSKSFCTQKVSYLSATKLYGLGYEYQAPFDATSGIPVDDKGTLGGTFTTPVQRFGGVRFVSNTPVISKSTYILNVGATYWNTNTQFGAAPVGIDPKIDAFQNRLQQGLRTAGLNVTLFKPLNQKNFIIAQANLDASGTYRSLEEITAKTLTYSGTLVYGWKKSDNFMWGLGVTRTYRAGQMLYVPVVLLNRTFNNRWGIEGIFPAKVNLRRNFGPSCLLMLGYEIEGNAFYVGKLEGTAGPQDMWVRRGELKPRITYEQKLVGFVWLSVQAGVRSSYRFLSYSQQNPSSFAFGETADVLKTQTMNSDLGVAPYFNVSINLVAP